MQLLERYGVLTREAALGEGIEGGFAGVYPVLKALEERGAVRRGYFVAGLGAAQFALPGAVDRLRSARDPRRTDALGGRDGRGGTDARRRGRPGRHRPGPALRRLPAVAAPPTAARPGPPARSWCWSTARPRPTSRRAAAACSRSRPRWSTAALGRAAAGRRARCRPTGRRRSLELAKIDGAPARESRHADTLRAAGFADGYQGLVLRSR